SLDDRVDAARDGVARVPAGPHVDAGEAAAPLPERLHRARVRRRRMSARTPAADVAKAADVLVRDYMAVRAGESVLITTDTATAPAVTEAIMVAVARVDARPSVLTIPRLPYQGALADPFIPPVVAGAVSGCTAWIDLTFP